jgi:hypothetical protein
MFSAKPACPGHAPDRQARNIDKSPAFHYTFHMKSIFRTTFRGECLNRPKSDFLSIRALGNEEEATDHFRLSAEETGDFSGMEAHAHGPLSYYRGLSFRELGEETSATDLFNELLAFGETGLKTKAGIDYFATSLPNLLVFNEDLQATADAENQHLINLAHQGLKK